MLTPASWARQPLHAPQSLDTADRTVRLSKKQFDASAEQWEQDRRAHDAAVAALHAQVKEKDEHTRKLVVALGEAQGEAEFATKAAEGARAECRREVRRLQALVTTAEERAEVRGVVGRGAGLMGGGRVQWWCARSRASGGITLHLCRASAEAGGATAWGAGRSGRVERRVRSVVDGTGGRHVDLCCVRVPATHHPGSTARRCGSLRRHAVSVYTPRRVQEATEARKELVSVRAAADEARREQERRLERTEQQLRRATEAAEDAQRQAATLQARPCSGVLWG